LEAAAAHAWVSQDHFSLIYFTTARCPLEAALIEQVLSFQGHPFSLLHFNSSRCPCKAAMEQVCSFQEYPFFLAHLSKEKYPPFAAYLVKHIF